MSRNLKGLRILTRTNRNVLPYTIAVGQVTAIPDKTTREVKALKMEQNQYLNMYFNKSFKFMSVDESSETKIGDVVLVRKLTNPPTMEKLFGIEKILFKVDNITDPITGLSNHYESEILAKHMNETLKKIE